MKKKFIETPDSLEKFVEEFSSSFVKRLSKTESLLMKLETKFPCERKLVNLQKILEIQLARTAPIFNGMLGKASPTEYSEFRELRDLLRKMEEEFSNVHAYVAMKEEEFGDC